MRAWNRTQARTRELESAAKAGSDLEIHATPAACGEGCDFAVTSLADGDALMAVLSGEGGLLHGKEPPSLLVETSTIGRRAALAAAEAARAKGVRYVDAPMSGTVGPARRGELVGLVGAEEEDLAAAHPVLDALCRKVIVGGAVGQGQALKVVLNGLGAHHFVAFASMLALGAAAGLSRETVVDAFTSGAFASPSYVQKRNKVVARDWSPEFSLSLARKDVRLNEELQAEAGLELPVVSLIARHVEEAIAEGLGDLDLFAIEEHFSKAHAAPMTVRGVALNDCRRDAPGRRGDDPGPGRGPDRR